MREQQDMEFPTKLLAWISDYLSLRKQQVIVDRATSSQCSVASGVSQASVLGPFLFSIYINEVGISANSYRALYADDVCCTVGYHNQRKIFIIMVQSDIDELHRRSEEQLLQMNPST